MRKAILKIIIIFVVLILGIMLVKAVEPTQANYSAFIDAYITSKGIWGMLIYILLVSVLACFAIPRQLLAFVGGYAYGTFFGTVFITIGISLTCVYTFYFARFIAQKPVQNRFGKSIVKLENFLNRDPMTMAIVIRLLPIGSNLATNMLAGVTKIAALPFFIGSTLGYLPQNLIFSLLGSGVDVDNNTNIAISAILFIGAILLGIYLFKKHKAEDMEHLIDE